MPFLFETIELLKQCTYIYFRLYHSTHPLVAEDWYISTPRSLYEFKIQLGVYFLLIFASAITVNIVPMLYQRATRWYDWWYRYSSMRIRYFYVKNEVTNCPICLEPGSIMICIAKCKHFFHRRCIDQWFFQQSADRHTLSCPVCRTKLLE